MPKKTSKKKTASKAVAKRGSTNVANIDEELEKRAQSIANNIGAPNTNKIRAKDKTFTFPDGLVERDEIQVVIVDFNSQNKFYPGAYDPNNPEPPSCFAISDSPKGMVPSSNIPDPECEDCDSCPNNQFGSKGAGKACKNTRVLAVLMPDATDEDEMMTLEVSPTGLRNFDAYVAKVAKDFNAPPVKVITTVSFHETKPHLIFSDPQPNANYAAHFGRLDEARAVLEVEPEVAETPKKPAKRRAGGRR